MTETKLRNIQFETVKEKSRFNKFIPLILIFIVIMLLESTVFQYRYFHPILTGAEAKTYSADDISVTADGSNQTVIIDKPGTKVTSVSLDASGDYAMSALWYDESSISYTQGKKMQMHNYTSRGSDYYMTTKGECKCLVLYIESKDSIEINAVKVNSPAYSINLLRIIFIFIAVSGLYLLAKFRPWQKPVSPSALSLGNKTVSSMVCVVYIIFMAVILLLSPGTELNTEHCSITQLVYSEPDKNDAFMMQTDALAKGQAHLDIIPSPELLALDNPYDAAQRSGVEYTWDFAFYDGAYYSYFGIVPVVLVLLPFRLITGQFLSSYFFAFLLGAVAAVMLCAVYRAAVRRFIPKINAFAYHIGLTAVICGSHLAYLSARSWFYEIPYNSSLLCIFTTLYFALSYDRAKNKKLNLLLTGLTYALAVGCRPIALMAILPIAPVIISNLGRKYLSYAWFAVPTAVVGILLGVWNIIRFDSFFDFGNAYQLTVSDVRFNSLLDFPVALDGAFDYLFGDIKFENTFPFFFAKLPDVNQQSHSMYSQPVTGLIRYPIYLCIGLLPFVFKRDKKFSMFALCGIIAGAMIIFSVAASGGVCERYTLDFRWIFALIGVLCALKLMGEYGSDRTSYNLLFGAIIAVSVAVSLAICIMGEFNRMATASKGFYSVMRDTFEILY